jgi:hypothetical protein
MTKRMLEWFHRRWQGVDPTLVHSYQVTFSTAEGQRVLQHLMDNIYCTIYEGTDPQAAALHNARRSVVHEILVNIDIGENPQRYQIPVTEEIFDAR